MAGGRTLGLRLVETPATQPLTRLGDRAAPLSDTSEPSAAHLGDESVAPSFSSLSRSGGLQELKRNSLCCPAAGVGLAAAWHAPKPAVCSWPSSCNTEPGTWSERWVVMLC